MRVSGNHYPEKNWKLRGNKRLPHRFDLGTEKKVYQNAKLNITQDNAKMELHTDQDAKRMLSRTVDDPSIAEATTKPKDAHEEWLRQQLRDHQAEVERRFHNSPENRNYSFPRYPTETDPYCEQYADPLSLPDATTRGGELPKKGYACSTHVDMANDKEEEEEARQSTKNKLTNPRKKLSLAEEMQARMHSRLTNTQLYKQVKLFLQGSKEAGSRNDVPRRLVEGTVDYSSRPRDRDVSLKELELRSPSYNQYQTLHYNARPSHGYHIPPLITHADPPYHPKGSYLNTLNTSMLELRNSKVQHKSVMDASRAKPFLAANMSSDFNSNSKRTREIQLKERWESSFDPTSFSHRKSRPSQPPSHKPSWRLHQHRPQHQRLRVLEKSDYLALPGAQSIKVKRHRNEMQLRPVYLQSQCHAGSLLNPFL